MTRYPMFDRIDTLIMNWFNSDIIYISCLDCSYKIDHGEIKYLYNTGAPNKRYIDIYGHQYISRIAI